MPGTLTMFYKIKLVIFVLSPQNVCFLLMDENGFLVETIRSRPKTHSNAPNQSIKHCDKSL
jgi:hypothetical protein